MNKNVMIVLGGAVLAAVLVAVLVQVTLGGKKKTVNTTQMVEILVAANSLKLGREIKEGDLRWQEWPSDTLFKGAITRKNDGEAHDALKGRLSRDISAGEALNRRSILRSTKGNFVVASLKDGERAIAIKVKAQNMVAGFISPGSFVDVILTYKERIEVSREEGAQIQNMVNLNLDKLATETILENIRVLAVDQKAEADSEDKIKVGKTVTLAVPIRDAEKLALAGEMGTITLAMRGVGDDKANEKYPAISDARLITIDDEIHKEYLLMKKDTGVNMNIVKIYNGAQVQSIPVR